MLAYWWPIILVVTSNTLYQVCAKSLPADVHPLASATVTYLVGALVTVILLRFLSHEQNLLREYTRINWTSFVLGVCVVGLEVGMLYTYRVGWPVSTASVVQAAFLAVSLLVVSSLLFHEPITANKVVGVAICLVGLCFLNK